MNNESEEYRKKCSDLLAELGACSRKEQDMAKVWQVEKVDYLIILQRLLKYREMEFNNSFHHFADLAEGDDE